jgi:hypothetical protein
MRPCKTSNHEAALPSQRREKVDRIVVLESRRIGEIGTPVSLYNRGGLYARLAALQRMTEWAGGKPGHAPGRGQRYVAARAGYGGWLEIGHCERPPSEQDGK